MWLTNFFFKFIFFLKKIRFRNSQKSELLCIYYITLLKRILFYLFIVKCAPQAGFLCCAPNPCAPNPCAAIPCAAPVIGLPVSRPARARAPAPSPSPAPAPAPAPRPPPESSSCMDWCRWTVPIFTCIHVILTYIYMSCIYMSCIYMLSALTDAVDLYLYIRVYMLSWIFCVCVFVCVCMCVCACVYR